MLLGGAGEFNSGAEHSPSVESRLHQSDHHMAGEWPMVTHWGWGRGAS